MCVLLIQYTRLFILFGTFELTVLESIITHIIIENY